MISIVIPALNEVVNLKLLLEHLIIVSTDSSELEIIVADGGSDDGSMQLCAEFNIGFKKCPKTQRASQMNYGARQGTGRIIYFLHADSFPPKGYDQKIKLSVENGAVAGCFTMKFDNKNPILSLYSWFTRFDLNIFRGGDQSLFVRRSDFEKLGGFNEELFIMEDYDMVKRLERMGKFEIINGPIITSSIKYKSNGVLRLQLIYFVIQIMYRMGISQQKLMDYYKRKVTN